MQAFGGGQEERSDGLFSLGDGGGKIDEIEFREVLRLMDEGRQRGFEFRQCGILLCALGGGDEGAQVSNSLFQRGGHNALRVSEITELRPTVLRVCPASKA
jgi:hypothetical protein